MDGAEDHNVAAPTKENRSVLMTSLKMSKKKGSGESSQAVPAIDKRTEKHGVVTIIGDEDYEETECENEMMMVNPDRIKLLIMDEKLEWRVEGVTWATNGQVITFTVTVPMSNFDWRNLVYGAESLIEHMWPDGEMKHTMMVIQDERS